MGGRNGLIIHSSMTVRGYNPGAGREMTIIYWFYYTDNSPPVRGAIDEYADVAGNACTAEDFTPPYRDSTYDDFIVFMPYDALDSIGQATLRPTATWGGSTMGGTSLWPGEKGC